MNIGGIDSSRIEAMMAQLKAAATKPAMPSATSGAGVRRCRQARRDRRPGQGGRRGRRRVLVQGQLLGCLKAQLDNVSKAQDQADDMGKKFAAGDDSVSLSDTMIAMQKASITFQATVQVRNKLVSAYHDIMNMQV
jgi:flagellar hook-basal body complex protein FliE